MAWEAIIGSTLTGLGTIVTAVGSLMLARSRQLQADLARVKAENTELEAAGRQLRLTALRHLSALERLMWQAGMSVPERPDDLL